MTVEHIGLPRTDVAWLAGAACSDWPTDMGGRLPGRYAQVVPVCRLGKWWQVAVALMLSRSAPGAGGGGRRHRGVYLVHA